MKQSGFQQNQWKENDEKKLFIAGNLRIPSYLLLNNL